MKKMFIMVLLSLAGWVQAGEYAYLVFTNTSGNKVSLSVTNLMMTINGSELQLTNVDGSATLVLTELASMEFSNDGQEEGIEDVLDGNQPLDVFTPLGFKIGHYDSLLQAAGHLSQGVYVITNGKNAQTIILK